MSLPVLAESSGWGILLLVLLVIVCFLLILVVLLQKGRGGGIGAAFGGAGSAAFGTRTGDVFTWITIVLTALFLILAVSSVALVRPKPGDVLPPVISREMNPNTGEWRATIQSPTDRSTVFYTLDGSDPQDKAGGSTKEARGSVKLEAADTVIKAKAVRSGYNASAIVTDDPNAKKPPADLEPETLPATTKPETKPAPETVPASVPAK